MLVVSSPHTTRASGAGATGERCAAPSAASGTPGSSTRATSTTRPPSAAAASAPPARRGSRPTSASRRPGWSSSSATASRQEFDRDKLASGLRKALTRRPVPDGAAETAADAIEAELRAAGATEVPSSRIGALAMEQLRAHRPDRLHPVRQRLPELRGPRGPQARGRHAATPSASRRRGARADERPVRPRHPGRARGRAGSASTRTTRPTSSRRRSTSTSTAASGSSATTATRSSTSRAPQPDLTELLDDRRRRAVHPPPGRVRPRPDARMGGAARRPRRQARGEVVAWAGSACSSTRPRATSTRAGRAT